MKIMISSQRNKPAITLKKLQVVRAGFGLNKGDGVQGRRVHQLNLSREPMLDPHRDPWRLAGRNIKICTGFHKKLCLASQALATNMVRMLACIEFASQYADKCPEIIISP